MKVWLLANKLTRLNITKIEIMLESQLEKS